MLVTKDTDYSVLMSVYKKDDPEYLKTAIESMLKQTVSPEQFVIVVDGPVSDEIENVIKEYENNIELFTVLRLKENGGLGNALNQGINVCRNELVARMDADDISCFDRCEKELKRFSETPNLCILGTQINEFIGNIDNIVAVRNVPCDYESIKKFARRRSPFNHPTVMYKKSVIQGLGGYPTLNRKEDLALFVLAVNNECYSENLEESLLFYRTSDSNKKRRHTWINCKEYIQVMYHFYRQGFLNLNDLLYVLVGQLSLFILPQKLTSIISNKYLRN